MNALKQLRAPLVLVVGVAFLTSVGCAGTKPKETNTGSGGVGGTGGIGPPPINGLESLTVAPTTATVTLTAGAAGTLTSPIVSRSTRYPVSEALFVMATILARPAVRPRPVVRGGGAGATLHR